MSVSFPDLRSPPLNGPVTFTRLLDFTAHNYCRITSSVEVLSMWPFCTVNQSRVTQLGHSQIFQPTFFAKCEMRHHQCLCKFSA